MNAELKAKWIAALRSGEYEQARESLCVVDSDAARNKTHRFCCLGVLCDLSETGRWAGSQRFPNYVPNDLSESHGGLLPVKLAEVAGITRAEQMALARMNDAERKSFAEIADYIEAHL